VTLGGENVSRDEALRVTVIVNVNTNAKRPEKSQPVGIRSWDYTCPLVLCLVVENRVPVDSSVLIQQGF
jgi:hypothetical protein